MNFVPDGKIRVAVLRGGPSNEYEQSLKTGASVLSHLRSFPGYAPFDIFISKDGEWHLEGRPLLPHEALRHADVAWNAMHGTYGGDGRVQQILTGLNLPYTGSGPAPSAMAHQRELASAILERNGIATTRFVLLDKSDFGDEHLHVIFRNLLHPVRVRPAHARAALSYLAHAFHELGAAVRESFKREDKVLVEEWPGGAEIQAGVIKGLKDQKFYGLTPPNLSAELKHKVQTTALLAHQALGLDHYSNSHCLVTRGGKVYVVETDPQPLFTEAPMSGALAAAGLSEPEMVRHLLSLALA